MSILLALATAFLAPRPTGDASPPELGRVRFERDLDRALERAKRESKPVFLLFQEIPGCSTCTSFGAGPLTHPLMVEAIEDEFVPCAIRNNVGGKEKETLERFREPAWNNPVVRFLDEKGEDVIARHAQVYDVASVARRMNEVLRRRGGRLPWLELVALETSKATPHEAVFAMPCFWTGQAALGGIDGVVAAEPYFLDGREVVRVEYAWEADVREIARIADASGCAARFWTKEPRELELARETLGDRASELRGRLERAPESDRSRHLARSPLRFVPMLEVQKLRVESDLARGSDPSRWLSPRQRELAREIAERRKARPDAFDDEALRAKSPSEFGQSWAPADLARQFDRIERALAR